MGDDGRGRCGKGSGGGGSSEGEMGEEGVSNRVKGGRWGRRSMTVIPRLLRRINEMEEKVMNIRRRQNLKISVVVILSLLLVATRVAKQEKQNLYLLVASWGMSMKLRWSYETRVFPVEEVHGSVVSTKCIASFFGESYYKSRKHCGRGWWKLKVVVLFMDDGGNQAWNGKDWNMESNDHSLLSHGMEFFGKEALDGMFKMESWQWRSCYSVKSRYHLAMSSKILEDYDPASCASSSFGNNPSSNHLRLVQEIANNDQHFYLESVHEPPTHL
ncbi:hypothetical protein ACH5RR_041073 [Cinchona calisaya]|uniref:Uncharacterized protein n=1 Tax=Cinchona calisaya TaxID=153742 RepID=A0ABD2XV33_9GENT